MGKEEGELSAVLLYDRASLAPYKVNMEAPGEQEKIKRVANDIFTLRGTFSACPCPGHTFIYPSDFFKKIILFHKQFSSR